MPRKHRQILPFRIPFFRIFYSTTYTAVFFVLLVFLGITPGTLLWEAIENDALQYVAIIGGIYILTGLAAIFIYSSRLYTNRIVLAGVGKAYIPVEDGEVGKAVRKLIASQLERSAIVSWEARPRDLKGEVLFAEREGLLSSSNTNGYGEVDTMGTIVPVEVDNPPWNQVLHAGWTAPSDATAELQSDLQFEVVVKELPNLIEARAVSLAPMLAVVDERQSIPDARFVELLRRQQTMGLREYLTQLSYLQLVDLDTHGREFLERYERARYSGVPTSYNDFKVLMLAFGNVMDSMKEIDPVIAKEIREQVTAPPLPYPTRSSQDSHTNSQEDISLVTAKTRVVSSYLSQANASFESVSSVLRASTPSRTAQSGTYQHVDTIDSLDSDKGSVLHHSID